MKAKNDTNVFLYIYGSGFLVLAPANLHNTNKSLTLEV